MVRLAMAGLEHLHRSLIGVYHPVLQNVVVQDIHQRLELHTATAHPSTDCGAKNGHPGTAKDGLLAVQRQVVNELGDEHLGQQPGGGDSLVDDVRRYGGLHQDLAVAARLFTTHMTRGWQSNFSATSSPMRCIWQPQRQVVESGSWRMSMRGSSAGNSWRFGWFLTRTGIGSALSCAISSLTACRSSSSVSSNRLFCAALKRSDCAANFRHLSSAFSYVSLSDGGLLEGNRLAQRLHHPAQFFCVQMQERVDGNVHEARVCQTKLCHAVGTSPN
jgi:hypothetical protein